MNSREFAEIVNRAINAGAILALEAAGLPQVDIDRVLARNVDFRKGREKKRQEIVEQNKKKLEKGQLK